jgi:uncharacterized protein (TIGR02118 family)
MIKMIAVCYRNPELTREEFRHHYDTQHVPLVKSLMGGNLTRYVRNYVCDGGTDFDVGNAPEYDCITEFYFPDAEAFKRAVAAVESPENAPAVRADEKRFLDVSRLEMTIVVEEERTDGMPS